MDVVFQAERLPELRHDRIEDRKAAIIESDKEEDALMSQVLIG